MSAYERLKFRIHELLEPKDHHGWGDRAVSFFVTALIIVNVLASILETVDSLKAQYFRFFDVLEVFSMGAFTVEYFLRVWICQMDEPYKGKGGRLRYLVSPFAILDLVAILPFYAARYLPIDLRFIRVLRLLRLFTLFKMARYTRSLRRMMNVLVAHQEELVITASLGAILLVFSSSVMYLLEHDAQPKVFSSIPATLWWGVVTLTTVGYGDMYPVTPAGKIFAGIIAFMGIGLFALPAGVIATGFAAEIARKDGPTPCPHCGKDTQAAPSEVEELDRVA